MEIDENIKKKIYETLTEREVLKKCQRCKKGKLEVGDNYFIQYSFNTFKETGYFPPNGGIPCIALICNKCGYIAQHSISDLGLIPSVIPFPESWNITYEE